MASSIGVYAYQLLCHAIFCLFLNSKGTSAGSVLTLAPGVVAIILDVFYIRELRCNQDNAYQNNTRDVTRYHTYHMVSSMNIRKSPDQ